MDLDINPDAITLYFFVGCFLSLFLSTQSLIRYIEEEIKQKDKNAFNEAINISGSKEKAKKGAKNTIIFLLH